jgi:aminoglycoside 3-N-acetyltransferase
MNNLPYSLSNKEVFKKISSALNKMDYNLALVHSDLFYGFKFEDKLPREQLLEAHLYYIKKMIGEQRPLWMPAFNYDFPKTKQFDVLNSKSQVGVLPEFFRTTIAKWRSVVPMFSFCGDDNEPLSSKRSIIDPFDELSLFHHLTKNNGLIIYYGASFKASTIIHYCERISGELYYRYDKLFTGEINDQYGLKQNVTLKYHVRPKSCMIEYDWELFQRELIENNTLLNYDDDWLHIKIIKALPLVEYWIAKMKNDRLSLLSKETQQWVVPKLDELGRPFQLSDFE